MLRLAIHLPLFLPSAVRPLVVPTLRSAARVSSACAPRSLRCLYPTRSPSWRETGLCTTAHPP
eukprot:scaffold153186_cov17-Tisochrysis_lutea.AAC.1